MAQSSKQRAEEAALDLKTKLRQLNKVLATKGATIAENAPLVDTIKAVEGMKAQASVTMTIFRSQQFYNYVDAELPPMRIADTYKPANLSYCFAQNAALKALPTIENIDMAVNMQTYASSCTSLTEVSLSALTNATIISNAFSGCTSLTSAAIGAAPKIADASHIFSGCNSLKDVSLDLSGGLLTNFSYAFNNCANLRKVTGIIDLSNATSSVGIFNGCSLLEEMRIKGLKADLNITECANLSTESVKYLVENLQRSTGKTISLAGAWQTAHTAEAREYAQKAAAKGFALTFR